jgi:hypothetical protein
VVEVLHGDFFDAFAFATADEGAFANKPLNVAAAFANTL